MGERPGCTYGMPRERAYRSDCSASPHNDNREDAANLEFSTMDRFSASAVAAREVASLADEARDHSVEVGALEVQRLTCVSARARERERECEHARGWSGSTLVHAEQRAGGVWAFELLRKLDEDTKHRECLGPSRQYTNIKNSPLLSAQRPQTARK